MKTLNFVPTQAIEKWQSIVQVFPLANQTLLPHMTLPLHLGRDDARLDLSDVGSDVLEVLVLNQDQLDGVPADGSLKLGCLAEVSWHDADDEGSKLLMLRGVCRTQFEIIPGFPLQAAVARISESYLEGEKFDFAALRQRIIQEVLQRCPELGSQGMALLLECELPLNQLVDLSAAPLGLTPRQQIHLLNTPAVGQRGELLLKLAEHQSRRAFTWRETFATN